jgi:hypothetical protein
LTGRHLRPVPFSGFATLRQHSSQRFPSRPKVCGLVSDRTVRGIPPFRVFPSREIADASRRSLAPLRLSTNVRRRVVRVLVTCGFPDVHAFTRLPGSPAGYELPFHAPKRASRSPWVSPRRTARSAGFTRFEASIPPASPFATGSSFLSPVGRYSPGFLPLWSFLLPRLGSSTRPSLGLEHSPFVRRLQARDAGDHDPLCRVRPFLNHE